MTLAQVQSAPAPIHPPRANAEDAKDIGPVLTEGSLAEAGDPEWRARGPYLPTISSKTGLVDETRQFLLAYAEEGDLALARTQLINTRLPQRSRTTRALIARIILHRLARWHPPAWVWDDLISFAQDERQDSLRAALLLHVTRQDTLLYDFVQQVVAPQWSSGARDLIRADVQRFLDGAQPHHPEIEGWSRETREKLAGNILSILRDYGLLTGTARKRIVEPLVPMPVVRHLLHLLQAEGLTDHDLPSHPDWRIWLWDAQRVQGAWATLQMQDGVA